VKDAERWNAIKYFFKDPEYGYFIKNADTVSKYLKFSVRSIAKEFPKGLFILSKHGKMIWTANTDTVGATIITIQDSVLPEKITKVKTNIDAEYIQKFKTQNVIGYVRGTEIPDSFIVFSAHYDHLGEMGEGTIFPGASDNASGTSLVLYLARYFAEHPQKYSVAFMLFSGEEAGLLGSTHYVQYPLFPLSQIKFLINLDITGDATNGITMVNGQTNAKEYNLMNRINDEQEYLPKINNREQTQNSDHYPFCNVGVKGIFIYGLGTKPYYHDVFDTADEITLENIDALSNLLIDFVTEYPGK
jgi:Zn-dependent M28 family amino/carboxypeptidase